MGWRGELAGPTGYLGMAAGRFRPDLVQQYFDRTGLPLRNYAGANLYAFGSGSDPDDLFFTFPESSVAAFGRQADVKAMLDVRQGSTNPLSGNSDFVNWEGELEGTAPQWGILNGKSAANLAALWIAGSGKRDVDFSSLAQSVRALLYRVQWDSGFSAHLVMVCDTPESAQGFATLLNLLQKAGQQPPAPGGATPPHSPEHYDASRWRPLGRERSRCPGLGFYVTASHRCAAFEHPVCRRLPDCRSHQSDCIRQAAELASPKP